MSLAWSRRLLLLFFLCATSIAHAVWVIPQKGKPAPTDISLKMGAFVYQDRFVLHQDVRAHYEAGKYAVVVPVPAKTEVGGTGASLETIPSQAATRVVGGDRDAVSFRIWTLTALALAVTLFCLKPSRQAMPGVVLALGAVGLVLGFILAPVLASASYAYALSHQALGLHPRVNLVYNVQDSVPIGGQAVLDRLAKDGFDLTKAQQAVAAAHLKGGGNFYYGWTEISSANDLIVRLPVLKSTTDDPLLPLAGMDPVEVDVLVNAEEDVIVEGLTPVRSRVERSPIMFGFDIEPDLYRTRGTRSFGKAGGSDLLLHVGDLDEEINRRIVAKDAISSWKSEFALPSATMAIWGVLLYGLIKGRSRQQIFKQMILPVLVCLVAGWLLPDTVRRVPISEDFLLIKE